MSIASKLKQLNSASNNNKHKSIVGSFYAIIVNFFFAIGNLVTAGYPTTSGLLLWRGVGVCGVSILQKPKFTKESLIVGIVHATHMITYVTMIRIGPSWFGAASLSAVPAIAWATRRNGSYMGAILVIIMLGAGVLFAIDPTSGSISNLSILLGIFTIIMVALRNELASLWSEKIVPNTAVLVAFSSASIVGVIMGLINNERLPLVFWPIVLAVGVGTLGHRAIYASAARCEPIVLSVATPVAIVTTSVGAYLFLDEKLPRGLQLVALIVWVLCGMWISFFLKTKPKNNTISEIPLTEV